MKYGVEILWEGVKNRVGFGNNIILKWNLRDFLSLKQLEIQIKLSGPVMKTGQIYVELDLFKFTIWT